MRVLIALIMMVWAGVALAQDSMTDAEREAFRAEVRAYLLDNPEVLIEAMNVLEERQAAAAAAADAELLADSLEDLTNDGVSFIGGNPDGDITMVEFMDYRCGYCRRAFPEVEALIATDGNIRYIIKEFPILGEQSTLAAQFALATKRVLGDAAYKDVHNTLMQYQGDITLGSLGRIAEGLALDGAAIMDEMGSPEVAKIIADNRALAQRLKINGTPSFVVADQLLRGYLPLDQMRALVEDIRG